MTYDKRVADWWHTAQPTKRSAADLDGRADCVSVAFFAARSCPARRRPYEAETGLALHNQRALVRWLFLWSLRGIR